MKKFIMPTLIVFAIALFVQGLYKAVGEHTKRQQEEAKKWGFLGSSLDESNFFYNTSNLHYDGEKGYIEVKENMDGEFRLPKCDPESDYCHYNKKVSVVIFDCKTRSTILVRSRYYEDNTRVSSSFTEKGFRLEAANILGNTYRLACRKEQ